MHKCVKTIRESGLSSRSERETKRERERFGDQRPARRRVDEIERVFHDQRESAHFHTGKLVTPHRKRGKKKNAHTHTHTRCTRLGVSKRSENMFPIIISR